MADIQRRREEREAREREETQQQQQREEEAKRDEARSEKSHLQEEGHPEKRPRTERSGTETEAAREVGSSQSRYKIGHMTNVYLTDSDEEAIVDHKELCDKTGEHFKDKARKEFLWQQFFPRVAN